MLKGPGIGVKGDFYFFARCAVEVRTTMFIAHDQYMVMTMQRIGGADHLHVQQVAKAFWQHCAWQLDSVCPVTGTVLGDVHKFFQIKTTSNFVVKVIILQLLPQNAIIFHRCE